MSDKQMYVDAKSELRSIKADIASYTSSISAQRKLIEELGKEIKKSKKSLEDMDAAIFDKREECKEMEESFIVIEKEQVAKSKEVNDLKKKYEAIVMEETRKLDEMKKKKEDMLDDLDNIREVYKKRSIELDELGADVKKESKKLKQDQNQLERDRNLVSRRIQTAQQLEKKLQDKAALMGILSKPVGVPMNEKDIKKVMEAVDKKDKKKK